MQNKQRVDIGVDPDSKAHGVAFYVEGELKKLKCMPLLELMDEIILCYEHCDVEMHIENVKGNSSSSFHHKKRDNKSVLAKKSESVGMCKQAQSEVERLAYKLGIKINHYKISKAWKKSTAQFMLATKWEGRSNEDTRSAAYFGFLGCKKARD